MLYKGLHLRKGSVLSVASSLISIAILATPQSLYAIDQAGCASWLSTAKLDDGSAAIGKDFAWTVNTSGVLMMDMGAAKVTTGTPSFPVGVRQIDLTTAVDQPTRLVGMGTFDVAADGTTYMAAAPDMGLGVGGNNVVKVSPTGAATVIATIDTLTAGFGDVYYAKGYVYVSNLGDGKVYKIDPKIADPASSFSAVYDHGKDGRPGAGLAAIVDADKGNGWGFKGTLGGRRVTALYVDGSTLFYGVMWRDTSDIQASWFKDASPAKTAFDAKSTASNWALAGEVWSVSLDASGNPLASTAKLLIDQSSLTNHREDKPVADLTINKDGKLLVATAPYNYNGSMGQHNGGLFALSKDAGGAYTVYSSYADIPGDEGNGGLDAFGDRVLAGGEYNIQNSRAYGFANITQSGSTAEINVGVPDNTTDFYSLFGENFNALSKGTTGDVEYICAGAATTPGCQTVTNSAQITASDTTDNNTANNAASADIEVCEAPVSVDVKLTKSVAPSVAHRGDAVVYTLTVTNEGANDATGVKLTDVLPAGVAYVSDNGDGTNNGSYDKTTGLWDVGNLAKGTSKTLNINAMVK